MVRVNITAKLPISMSWLHESGTVARAITRRSKNCILGQNRAYMHACRCRTSIVCSYSIYYVLQGNLLYATFRILNYVSLMTRHFVRSLITHVLYNRFHMTFAKIFQMSFRSSQGRCNVPKFFTYSCTNDLRKKCLLICTFNSRTNQKRCLKTAGKL